MLDEAEPAEGVAANLADELARGSWPAASFRIFLALSLRHKRRACHSDLVTANAAKRLIQHYVDNFRQLPWRSAPGEKPPEPYRVWLSEVMLQQTTVAAVRPRFELFLARWPTVEALAAASDADILGEWAGLGYYARARNLIACAREVVRRGGFPQSSAELRQLPGIGAYTSAAIAAIAFGESCPAVDTNVRRVLARLNGLRQPTRVEIETRLVDLLPADRPGDALQAIMDLGATICRVKAPRCDRCPLAADCKAFLSRDPDRFPEPVTRAARPHRHGIAYWTQRDEQLWLVRRPERGLLAGMSALPGDDWATEQPPPDRLATVRHVFTHFSLDLHIVRRAEPVEPGWWQPLHELERAGLPTLYRKAATCVLSSNSQNGS